MSRGKRFGIGALLLATIWSGAARAADSPEPTPPSEAPGEISVRLPDSADFRAGFSIRLD